MLEVTENIFIEELDSVNSQLGILCSNGYEVSLDDFGTGYSSLSVLNELAINEVKIDKSFVDDMELSEQRRTMVQNIINIGKSLNMLVLAEGIESQKQADFLTDMGCHLFQGYYFGKPMRIDALTDYLKSQQL